jgi:AcrR family transcriptional regulator
MAAAARGRPRSFDREEALARATTAFWERGFEPTSISDLTEAIGISAPSLYAAFGDKRTLFREVVESYARHTGNFTWRALTEETTAREAVERILNEAAYEYTVAGRPKGCLILSADANCSASSADVGAWLRERRQANINEFETRIQADIDSGVLSRETTDAHTLALITAAAMNGMSQLARDGAAEGELRAVAEAAMRAWPPLS